MIDFIAVGTLLLAVATFTLAFFTFRMARETRNVASGTEQLAKAAQDQLEATREQVRIASEELSQLRDEAASSREPQVILELDTDEVFSQVSPDELAGSDSYFLIAKMHLANYGGHAFVERLHPTGKPEMRTRPSDVAGYLPSGGRMSFQLRFDWNNELNERPSGSVPVCARAQRSDQWRETLFFVNVRFVHGDKGVGGWRAEIKQALNARAADE